MLVKYFLTIIILTFLLIGTQIVQAQDQVSYFSKDLLEAEFRNVLEVSRKKYSLPGITAAYHFVSGQFGSVATGYADLERKEPMKNHSRMLSASIGKTFVGATVLYLEHKGEISREKPIDIYLKSEPWISKLENASRINVNHLLTHSSGIADYVYTDSFTSNFKDRWGKTGKLFDSNELIQFALAEKARFRPGEGWAYSDTGYIILGKIIEKVSSRKYYDLVDQLFLKKFGLKNTSPADRVLLKDLAAGYLNEKKSSLGLPQKTNVENGALVWNPSFEWTGGGFVSTSEDLARWGMLLFGGNALPFKYLEDLLFAPTRRADGDNNGYGLGVAVKNSDKYGNIYGHAGWIPGYVSSMRYYPNFKVSIAFQVNTDIGFKSENNILQNIEDSLVSIFFKSSNRSGKK